jgi:hypothetical protein
VEGKGEGEGKGQEGRLSKWKMFETDLIYLSNIW